MDDLSRQFESDGFRPDRANPPANLSAFRWSLFDLFLMVAVTGAALRVWMGGEYAIAAGVIATAMAIRVAVIDFSLIGAIANGLAVLFGLPTLVMILLWAMK